MGMGIALVPVQFGHWPVSGGMDQGGGQDQQAGQFSHGILVRAIGSKWTPQEVVSGFSPATLDLPGQAEAAGRGRPALPNSPVVGRAALVEHLFHDGRS